MINLNKLSKKMIPDLILSLFFFLSFFISTSIQAVEIKNDITTDTIFTSSLSPYLITATITVAKEVTLTIEPGVKIIFQKASESTKGYGLKVKGTLIAKGTKEQPILFTIEEKNNYWGHLEFTEESTPFDEVGKTGCQLNYCMIEYGGDSQVDTYDQAAIRCIKSSPLIEKCIIRYSKADGILSFSGQPILKDNRIHDTICGLKIISPQGGLVENNYFINNQQGINLGSGSESIEIKKNTVKSTSPEIYGGCLGLHLQYENHLLSYAWEQVEGPEVVLANPNSIKPTFTAPDLVSDQAEEKNLLFRLTVNDQEGLVNSDLVQVKVDWENKPPVAVAGPDQTVKEGARVILDSASSFDPEGGLLSYAWERTSDPNAISLLTLSDPNAAQCGFFAPIGIDQHGQTHVFQLTVTDSSGLTAKDTVVINLTKETPLDRPPTAEAGVYEGAPVLNQKSLTVEEGDTVITLDGTGSLDQEGEIISWLWWQTEGTPVIIDKSTSPDPNFALDPNTVGQKGECLLFQLTVTDLALQSTTDTVAVNIIDTDSNSPNHPPVAKAGLNQIVIEGATVALSGTATDPEGDTDMKTYVWEQVAGPSVTLAGAGKNRSFTAPNVTRDETLIFRFTVTDASGLKGLDTMKVVITWANDWPIAEAGADQTVKEGERVLLDGSNSSDFEGSLVAYLWEQLSGPVVTLSSDEAIKPFFTAPQTLTNQQLIFQLTVVDQDGYASYEPVNINLTAQNDPPKAVAGPDRAVAAESVVQLDGTGSYDQDPNSLYLSYLWEQTSGPQVTLYNQTAPSPYFTAPALEEGEDAATFLALSFQLTVKDAEGLSSSDLVMINIVKDITLTELPETKFPEAKAGPDQTVLPKATVTLNGSGSRDPDFEASVVITNNSFILDKEEEEEKDTVEQEAEAGQVAVEEQPTGNAIAIRKSADANSSFLFSSNNLEKKNGHFLVYLHDWPAADSAETLLMKENWWGSKLSNEIGLLIYDRTENSYMPQIDYQSFKMAKISGAGSGLSYPPIAEAGDNQTVEPDEEVILDGTTGSDPNQIMAYKWEQIEGPKVTLLKAQTAKASFIAPALEEEEDSTDEGVEETSNQIICRLTVTAADGFYDTDEVTITIETPTKEDKKERKSKSGCFLSFIKPDFSSATYYSFGFGRGGKAKEQNLTLEIGNKNVQIRNRTYLIAAGFPFLDHGEKNIPSETIGSAYSYPDKTSLGKKPEGLEIGLLGKIGREVYPHTYLSVLGGFTRVREIELVRSNATQKIYEQSSDSAFYGLIGFSVGYFRDLFSWKTKVNVQVDLDPRRGLTGYFGWSW